MLSETHQIIKLDHPTIRLSQPNDLKDFAQTKMQSNKDKTDTANLITIITKSTSALAKIRKTRK